MRLRHRSTVVLPQPDGPMNAVISLAAMSRSTSRTAVCPLYFTSRSRSSKTSSPLALGLLVGGAASSGASTSADRGVDVGRHVDDVSGEVDERGHGSVLGGHAACRRAKKAVTSRARIVKMNTIAISVSAAPHARSCAAGNGDVALLKICTDSAVFGPLNRLSVGLGHDADGEEQRRGLARGAGDREQRAAHDARRPRRQHDGADRAGLAAPERVAALAQLARHERQHLVGGADHDRQHQARQRERAGEAGLLLRVAARRTCR